MEDRLIELLLGCLHWEAGHLSAQELAGLNDADWEAFLALAAQQCIRPLLYQRLTKRGLEAVVPERVMGALRAVIWIMG